MNTPRDIVEGYARRLETLDREGVEALVLLCAPDVRFADPFNEVRGRQAMAHVFRDMFDRLDEVGFEAHEILQGPQGWAIRFTFHASGSAIGRLRVPGMTYLRLDAEGCVAEHEDVWDGGQIYEQLPLLGRVVRQVKRRIAA